MIRPSEVMLYPDVPFVGTFGKAETEQAAAILVRWHQLNSPDEWTSISRRELGNWMCGDINQTDEMLKIWTTNPFFRPSPIGLIDGGLITGWEGGRAEADNKGTVTDVFLEKLERWRLPS